VVRIILLHLLCAAPCVVARFIVAPTTTKLVTLNLFQGLPYMYYSYRRINTDVEINSA